jgi:hypothetical protein
VIYYFWLQNNLAWYTDKIMCVCVCLFACVVNKKNSFLLPKYSFNTQTRIDTWFIL